ncbi:MAG: 3-deoxy-D-manno-octulosonic acid transferase [Micavibrio aeruginosavorus]|uniref:3-deoxy-D-manno-octulosonic acid transferase n=1 Tax=Micavibrio aeruginosavorus TaxID=349221 RepID=A0A7T5R090_9BACT|nr:MAG: 3-deoxy-D-manno-octulosonic acid transferase [Micavibrio aeruginosavorus]
MKALTPALSALLERRLTQGKEEAGRIEERRGNTAVPRPDMPVIWIHGASVGEAQSTLIVINHLQKRYPDAAILLTTGTVTSAQYLENRLPAGVIHQYIPLDHPEWVDSFFNHWKPQMVLWMESELWPILLAGIRERNIPALLLNARLSPRSYQRWRCLSIAAKPLLCTFSAILAQTGDDAARFKKLGAGNVAVTGNLKYASTPLPCDPDHLALLRQQIGSRPVWLYASTHKGEEELACRLHLRLAADIPDLLTVVVPRHPERGEDIMKICQAFGVKALRRTAVHTPPDADTQLYIADTLGELGLFYRACPVACIGRSFSDDGGGGHNPIEAAQLGCAVLHGPRIQNLFEIYRDMNQADASCLVRDKNEFYIVLRELLRHPEKLKKLADSGQEFTRRQSLVLPNILGQIYPVADRALTPVTGAA